MRFNQTSKLKFKLNCCCSRLISLRIFLYEFSLLFSSIRLHLANDPNDQNTFSHLTIRLLCTAAPVQFDLAESGGRNQLVSQRTPPVGQHWLVLLLGLHLFSTVESERFFISKVIYSLSRSLSQFTIYDGSPRDLRETSESSLLLLSFKFSNSK